MSRKTNLIYPTIYRYLLACHEMRLSVKTVSWYEQKVEAFRWYLMEQWQIKNLTSITEKHVEAFLMVLDEVSPITIKAYRQALNGLFRWCVEQELLEVNPMVASNKNKTTT